MRNVSARTYSCTTVLYLGKVPLHGVNRLGTWVPTRGPLFDIANSRDLDVLLPTLTTRVGTGRKRDQTYGPPAASHKVLIRIRIWPAWAAGHLSLILKTHPCSRESDEAGTLL